VNATPRLRVRKTPAERAGWDGVKLARPKKRPEKKAIEIEAEKALERRLDKGAMDLARAMLDKETNKLKLYPYQKIVFDKWFNDMDLIVYCLVWGRRAGKTTTLSGIAATELVMRPNTLNIWVTPTYEQGRIPMGCIKHILRAWGELNEKGSTRYNLVCKNGSVMYFRSWQQAENLLGLGPNTIFLDEARLLTAPDFEVVFWPMVLTSKGRIIMASSQSGPRGFFFDTQIAGKEGPKHVDGYLTHEVWSESNPLCDPKRMDMFKRQFGKVFERECHCVPLDLDDEGYLFKQDVLACGMAPAEEKEYKDMPVVLAIDAGGCLGTSGWAVAQGAKLIHSGAEAFGGFERLLEKTEELLDKFNPDAIATDGTSLGGNAFEFMLNMLLKSKGVSIPMFPVNFSAGADDIDKFANWRTEALFSLRDDMLEGRAKYDPEKDKALHVQLQTVRCATDDRNRHKCVSKLSQRDMHTEDTVDAWMIAREGQRRLGSGKRDKQVALDGRAIDRLRRLEMRGMMRAGMKGYIHA